jgi:hypothetical protein
MGKVTKFSFCDIGGLAWTESCANFWFEFSFSTISTIPIEEFSLNVPRRTRRTLSELRRVQSYESTLMTFENYRTRKESVFKKYVITRTRHLGIF